MKRRRVVVIGQGYVGLPLAMRAVEVGHRVTGYDTPYPPATIESHYVPSVERILDAVDRVTNY